MKLFIKRNKIELILTFLLLLIGLLCVFLSGKTIMIIITYLMGVFFIASGITVLVGTIKNRSVVMNDLWLPITQGIVLIILGSCLFIFPGHLVRLIVGAIFLIIPTIKIILHNNKKETFLKELYKYIIGLIFIISIDIFLDIIFFIIGLILLIGAVILLVYTIKSFKKDQSNSLMYKIFIKKILKEVE